MKQVFITGADGMLGSNICRELLAQGYRVKALRQPGRQIQTLSGLEVETVEGDILHADTLPGLMSGCHFVIHVAVMTNVWPSRMAKITEINLHGTMNIMQSAEKLGMERMVYIGSASSFDHGPIHNPGNESRDYSGSKFGFDYIDSKYFAQEKLLKKSKEDNFPVIIINPTYMIGPYDSGPSSGRLLLAVASGKLKWYSSGGKNFVCATDVAKAAVNALHMGKIGECYIAGNENLSYKEFFRQVSLVLNKPFQMKYAPYPAMLMFSLIASGFATLKRKPPMLTYKMARFSKEYQYYNPEKARKELNMPQTPVREGIRECLQWFRENHYL